jgi:hypothetical protein
LVNDSTSGVGAVGSVNGSKACVYFPVASYVPFGTSGWYDSYAVGTTTTPSAAVNVIISNTGTSPRASFLQLQPTVGANWQGVADFLGLQKNATTQPLTTSDVLPATGQALLPDGGFLIGAVSSGGGMDIFEAPWPGGLPNVTSGNLGADKKTGVPVVASASEAYAGHGGGLFRFDPSNLNASTIVIDGGTTDTFYLSPILSKAKDGGVGQGYAVSNTGNLVVFELGSAPGVAWTSATGTSVVTHPTLDCNRQSPATRTGILYVGHDDGHVQAIIVDNPGLLDTPGAWPKYQRSAGNAGNDDLLNFPTNWPGCP